MKKKCQCKVCRNARGEISDKQLIEMLLCEIEDLHYENMKQKDKI